MFVFRVISRGSLKCAIFAFIAICAPLLAQDSSPGFLINPPPAWVDAIDYPVDQNNSDTIGGLAYRLFDRQTRYHDGQSQQFRHLVMEVTNQSGLSDAAKIQVDFDPEYQQLTFHQARIIRDGVGIDSLDADEISVVRTENDLDNDLYNGVKTALLVVDDLRVGDLLEYSYTVSGDNPVFLDSFFDTYAMQWSSPVNKNYLSIEVPDDLPVELATPNLEAKYKTRKNSGFVEYYWLLENQPEVEMYDDSPLWHSPLARVEISQYRHWSEVVDWALNLYDGKHLDSPELEQLVSDIRNQHASPFNQASAALQYVQDNIRYYGIELGVNSHQPSQPLEVLERKYGDCKDKSVLLVYLLNQLGIQAHPALVSTTRRRNITERLPSPGVFNHVIAKAVINDEIYWIDPTLSFQSSQISTASELRYEYALVIAPGVEDFEAIHSATNAVDKISIVETFDTTSEDDAEMLIVSTGNEGVFSDAQRASVAYNNSRELAKSAQDFYSSIYGGNIESLQFDIADNRENNVITVDEQYRIDRHWEVVGRYERLQTYAHTLSGFTKLPSEMNRDWPVAVRYPLNLKHDIVIKGPANHEYTEAGFEQVSTDNLTYNRKIDITDDGISISHQFYTNHDMVPVDKLTEHYDALRKIHDLMSYVVVRDHAREDAIKQRESRIQSLLKKKLENN